MSAVGTLLAHLGRCAAGIIKYSKAKLQCFMYVYVGNTCMWLICICTFAVQRYSSGCMHCYICCIYHLLKTFVMKFAAKKEVVAHEVVVVQVLRRQL